MGMSKPLLSGIVPALEQGSANTRGAILRMMIFVVHIGENSARGTVVGRSKRLVPIAEYVLAGIYDRMLKHGFI